METMEEKTASAEDPALAAARKRAEDIQGLYIHLMIYAVVNASLFVINALARSEDGSWWVIWPVVGWGIGLLIHLMVTIVPVFTPDWAERRARRMIERHV